MGMPGRAEATRCVHSAMIHYVVCFLCKLSVSVLVFFIIIIVVFIIITVRIIIITTVSQSLKTCVSTFLGVS